MKQITINTDASYYNHLGAWAYWIDLPDGKTLKDYGMFAEPVDSSCMAELQSFQIALQKVIELYGDFPPLDIRFFCDNLWVVRSMNGDVRQYDNIEDSHMAEATTVYRTIAPHQLKAFHVKAHAPRLVTMAQRTNNWCDFHARETVRRELRKLKDMDIDYAKIES